MRLSIIYERKFDKSTISNCASLKFFDPKFQTKTTCDVSKFGLGATLEQKFNGNWGPIAFVSRTLTPAEFNYCQLEKETSIVFTGSEFHEYVYGRNFLIENDHKPLKTILAKQISKAPQRNSTFHAQRTKI